MDEHVTVETGSALDVPDEFVAVGAEDRLLVELVHESVPVYREVFLHVPTPAEGELNILVHQELQPQDTSRVKGLADPHWLLVIRNRKIIIQWLVPSLSLNNVFDN